MKHTELLILSLLFLPQFTTAQSLLVGRVVDAETGETLPFAKVMMADNHGTLSNRDGDFSIMGTADDVLTVSYIGYEKETVKATALPAIIRLKPLVAEMGEVVVLPQPKGDIMDSIRRKLHAEYVANWDKTSLYFFRAFTEREDSISDILEGFYDAFSAVNIGRPVIKSGQTRMFGKTDAKELLKTNFQRLFLLGPVIYEENFWTRTLQPLGESDEFKKVYDANFITMYTEEGQKIYKIRFLFNGWAPKDWQSLDSRNTLCGCRNIRPATFRRRGTGHAPDTRWRSQGDETNVSRGLLARTGLYRSDPYFFRRRHPRTLPPLPALQGR